MDNNTNDNNDAADKKASPELPFASGDGEGSPTGKDAPETTGTERKAGRRKINIEYIEDKSRRHITFSKRKAGIMKKAYELSTLTGTQVLLLVASETGHVYTFATPKLQPLITKPEGKNLIQACLNVPDIPPAGAGGRADDLPFAGDDGKAGGADDGGKKRSKRQRTDQGNIKGGKGETPKPQFPQGLGLDVNFPGAQNPMAMGYPGMYPVPSIGMGMGMPPRYMPTAPAQNYQPFQPGAAYPGAGGTAGAQFPPSSYLWGQQAAGGKPQALQGLSGISANPGGQAPPTGQSGSASGQPGGAQNQH